MEFINDIFSKFNKSELSNLINQINLFKLYLRDMLYIDKHNTFGLEIECEYVNWDEINEHKNEDWILAEETSLCNGAELKSPILTNTRENWYILKEMCELVSKNSSLSLNSGGHIHIGKQALESSNALINFMKLWVVYEHIILRFSYGEFLGPRPAFNLIAKPVKLEYINLLKNYNKNYIDNDDLLYYLSNDKDKAVNFKHFDTLKTIEFRCPNGTFNPAIWQNNVNLFVNMLMYASDGNFDEEFINNKLKSSTLLNKTSLNVYLDEALEFVDLIFNNNLDKICFLKQYLKSFECIKNRTLVNSFMS